MDATILKHSRVRNYTSPDALVGGVTEQKKTELNALVIQVFDAQQNVDQFQAIVNSLTEKSNNIQGFLAVAESDRTYAYNNKLLIDQMSQVANDLKNNSKIANDEMSAARVITNKLAPEIKVLVDKLIFAAEFVNKLSNIIIRKKALNPLISDDLISMLGTAGKNANDAVALTLIALQSTFAAQASNLETEMAIALEHEQAIDFVNLLKGENQPPKTSLVYDLNNAYTEAKSKYKLTEQAYKLVTKQLNHAVSDLNKAQVKLKSLQSGLAAANAAALAS